MLYSAIKKNIDEMIEDIEAGKEECHKMISCHLINNQNIPVTIKAVFIKMLTVELPVIIS